MLLFLLTPVDRLAFESVQVEAESEERARRRANLFFGRKAGGPAWDQRHLVTARVIEEADPAVRLILAGDAPP